MHQGQVNDPKSLVKLQRLLFSIHTLHFVVKGELLSCLYPTSGKERYPWQPLIQVINKHIIYLKVWVTLRTQKKKKKKHFCDIQLFTAYK